MCTDQKWYRSLFVLIVTGMLVPVAPTKAQNGLRVQGYLVVDQINSGTRSGNNKLLSIDIDEKDATTAHLLNAAGNYTIGKRGLMSLPTPDGNYIITMANAQRTPRVNSLDIYLAPSYNKDPSNTNIFKTISLSSSFHGTSNNGGDGLTRVNSVISTNGKYVYIPVEEGAIDVFRTDTWDRVETLDSTVGNTPDYLPVSLSIGKVATSSGDRSQTDTLFQGFADKIVMYNGTAAPVVGSLKINEAYGGDNIISLTLSSDGKTIYFITGNNKVLKVSATELTDVSGDLHAEQVSVGGHDYGIAVSPSGRYIATGSKDGDLNLYLIDTHKNNEKKTIKVETERATVGAKGSTKKVSFSADEKYLYFVSFSNAPTGSTRFGVIDVDSARYLDKHTLFVEEKNSSFPSFSKGYNFTSDLSNFIAPYAVSDGAAITIGHETDLKNFFGPVESINIQGGMLTATGEVYAANYVVSMRDNARIDVAEGHTMTVGDLSGTVDTFSHGGGGTFVIANDSPSFTSNLVSIGPGTLDVRAEKGLGGTKTVSFREEGILRFGQGATNSSVLSVPEIRIDSGGGSLDVVAGTVKSQIIGGEADAQAKHSAFYKLGSGTLDLTAQPAATNVNYNGDWHLNAGRTLIDEARNLGINDNSNIYFDGGTLAVNDHASGSATSILKTMIFLENGGTIEVNTTKGAVLNGLLQGEGELVKTGPQPLTIAGTGLHENTRIVAGTLAVKGGQALKNTGGVFVDPQATFEVQESQAIGMLKGKGTVSVAVSQVLTLGGGDRDSSFSGTFSGAGSVNKIGTGTSIYNGVSSSPVPVTVSGGTWVVGSSSTPEASMAGSVTVANGGQLSGEGTVGSGSSAGDALTVQSGGTVAPGNSAVGTLKVNGNVTLQPGSVYVAEIGADSTSDQIDATGTVALGGKLQLSELSPFVPGHRYTLVHAEQGVQGEFSNANQDLPLLNLSLASSSDRKFVYLDATRNDKPIDDFGKNQNEKKTADEIDNLEPDNPLKDAVISLKTEDEIEDALVQTTGDLHSSIKSAVVQDSHFLRDATLGRLQDAFTPGGRPGTPVMAYSKNRHTRRAQAHTKDNVFWTQVFGAWGRNSGQDGAAKLSQTSAGAFFGTDTRVGEHWRVGGVLGYSTLTLNAHAHHSSARSDNFHLGAYGGGQWGAWGLRAGAGYSWYGMNTKRLINISEFSDSLKGNIHASTVQLFSELAYQVGQGRSSLEPFINLALVSGNIGELNEDGGAAALHGTSGKMTTAFTTLGLHGSTHFVVNRLEALARATLGWRRAYGKMLSSSENTFAGNSNSVTIYGAPIDRNTAVLEMGMDVAATKSMTVGLTYAGEAGRKTQHHSGQLNFGWKF